MISILPSDTVSLQHTFVGIVLTLVCGACFSVDEASAKTVVTRVVTLERDSAPDGNGTLSVLGFPFLNEAEEVAFGSPVFSTSDFPNDNAGIFLGNGTTLTQIARKGQPLPDANGSFDGFTPNASTIFPAINDIGQVAFWASISGSGIDHDKGIFRGDGTTTTQIVRRGQSAPDGNGDLLGFSSTPKLNNQGQVAFKGALAGTSGGTDDDFGIFRANGTTITQIARKGQIAPDNNGQFSEFDTDFFVQIDLNNSNQVSFFAELTGTSGGSNDNAGIFLGDGSSLAQIARKGQSAPDGNGSFSTFDRHMLNNAGQVAFEGELMGTNQTFGDETGIFVGDGSTLIQAARRGQPAPDGNGEFNFFSSLVLNDVGQVAFRAVLRDTRGGPDDERGIFLFDGTSLTQIARAGQATPDGSSFLSVSEPSLNNAGQVAFAATLPGTDGSQHESALFLADKQLKLTQILREGESSLLGSTVTTISLYPGFLGDDRASLNELGQVAYRFGLADGRSGIAISMIIPEPCTCTLALAALCVVISRR